jgi:hypothetical protein
MLFGLLLYFIVQEYAPYCVTHVCCITHDFGMWDILHLLQPIIVFIGLFVFVFDVVWGKDENAKTR